MHRAMTVLCSLVAAVCATAAFAEAAPEWERRYDCMRTTEPIVVDGVGDELAWQLAADVGAFTRFQSDNTVPAHHTTAKMLWDQDHLYFLVAVEDRDIWSTMTEGDRDCLCLEETIELFIDPDGDGRDYAEIHINCLDTINDIWIPSKQFQYADGSPVDWPDLFAWTHEGMQHAVRNHGTVNDSTDIDRGSVYEFALPWAGFGKIVGKAATPPRAGDVWRVNVNRYERVRGTDEKPELSGWAPLERFSYHVPERYGYVRFVGDGD